MDIYESDFWLRVGVSIACGFLVLAGKGFLESSFSHLRRGVHADDQQHH